MRKVILPWPTDKEFVKVISQAEKLRDELQKSADVDTSPIINEEEWFKRGREAYAVLRAEMEWPINHDFLKHARKLRMVQTPSIGYDGIDIEACTDHSVIVCIVVTYSESVAQHTWALILNVSKHIAKADRVMRIGGWPDWPTNFFGIELHGTTLGVIGLGDIGRRVALKGSLAFNMRVLAYNPFVDPTQAQLYHARLVDLETLLRESDIISIHCPLTPSTWHLIGAEQLKLLKSTAILVNTARGAIIDQTALIEALEKEQLFGAGLDVFEEEPLSPLNPLRRLENVILTPHLAYATKKAVRNTWIGAVGNILRFMKGQKPNWILNPTVLSRKRGYILSTRSKR
ncbi:hypothetical protein AC480_03375 [miscellaneous Crenarchaeota group archaeon SMTZ1-55]|nr:MAG: hypothetical protein AC480_03375 [miscellaneous Crenarchaeota group archaeon SMTZ1-55]